MRPAVTAREHYRKEYGYKLAEDVAVPLTEAWSGCQADRIAAAVGHKFATSLPRMMMLRASAAITKRVIGIGYASTITESTDSWHVYPKDGIAAVCQKLADEVSDNVRLQSKVEAIHVEQDVVTAITCNGQQQEVSGVISTAPVNFLAKMVRGSDKLAALQPFRYRAMVFVNLKLEGASGLRDVVNWFPESRYPFFRVSDIGMGLPWLVPSGKAQVTCDIGCQIGDEHWNAADETLTQQCIKSLEQISPGVTKRLLGSRVVRVPLAYPIYDLAYEDTRQAFSKGTGIRGLLSVGRNGEFAHILMEDVYWRTRWKVSEFIDDVC
jgi:protoporphyrinogen oxidase